MPGKPCSPPIPRSPGKPVERHMVIQWRSGSLRQRCPYDGTGTCRVLIILRTGLAYSRGEAIPMLPHLSAPLSQMPPGLGPWAEELSWLVSP